MFKKIHNKKIVLFLMLFNVHFFSYNHFISFIMPCFNCEQTVVESICSIYDQKITYPFEIICTDDGSTDGTIIILRAFEKCYNNFHVYVHKKNKSGGAASNTCVKYAKGDLFFRLDSDNILAEDTIDRLVELIDSSGCDAASVQELRFFQENKNAEGSWFYRSEGNICDLAHGISVVKNPIHSGNYLFTRDSFERAGGYPEDHGCDTFRFGFKQLATGSKIAILPDTFYWHRDSKQKSYWRREEEKGTNNIKALETMLEYQEVFSLKTQQLLIDLKKKPQKIFEYVEHKKLHVVSPDALNELFMAYKDKQQGDIIKSLKHLKKAKKLGCKSKKLKQLISALKKKI